MRLTVSLTAALALCAGSMPALAHPSAAGGKNAQFQLNQTTWTFVDPEKKVKARESIDPNGNYIQESTGGKHMDHGTAMMKDGKACFTSAMTSNGEECWTVKPVAVGHSMVATSDKGDKLTVTRAKYTPLHMPK